jgi:hypothetical protein
MCLSGAIMLLSFTRGAFVECFFVRKVAGKRNKLKEVDKAL